MLDILEKITRGEGTPADIELLESLSRNIKRGSLCALGGTAPNPVITTLRYFREDYEEHVAAKKCRARVCRGLIAYYIQPDKCRGCGLCLKNCPAAAISGGKQMVHIIDQDKCTRCGVCLEVCPPKFEAVYKASGEVVATPPRPVPVKTARKEPDKS
jgi:NADH-quinone oxidoreductase subunit F